MRSTDLHVLSAFLASPDWCSRKREIYPGWVFWILRIIFDVTK